MQPPDMVRFQEIQFFTLWLKPGLLGRVKIIRLHLKITVRLLWHKSPLGLKQGHDLWAWILYDGSDPWNTRLCPYSRDDNLFKISFVKKRII
jgi:hypothetical protein